MVTEEPVSGYHMGNHGLFLLLVSLLLFLSPIVVLAEEDQYQYELGVGAWYINWIPGGAGVEGTDHIARGDDEQHSPRVRYEIDPEIIPSTYFVTNWGENHFGLALAISALYSEIEKSAEGEFSDKLAYKFLSGFYRNEMLPVVNYVRADYGQFKGTWEIYSDCSVDCNEGPGTSQEFTADFFRVDLLNSTLLPELLKTKHRWIVFGLGYFYHSMPRELFLYDKDATTLIERTKPTQIEAHDFTFRFSYIPGTVDLDWGRIIFEANFVIVL